MQMLLLLCVAAAAAEQESEPEGEHASRGPLLAHVLGAVAAPAAGFHVAPAEPVVLREPPPVTRAVANPVADTIVRVASVPGTSCYGRACGAHFVDPFPRSDLSPWTPPVPSVRIPGTTVLADAASPGPSADVTKLRKLLLRERELTRSAADLRAELGAGPMREMLYTKLFALEDECTGIGKEQQRLGGSATKMSLRSAKGAEKDRLLTLEKSVRMLDAKANVLDTQADGIRKELGLSPGYYGSRQQTSGGVSPTLAKATMTKLAQLEKQQASLDVELIQPLRSKLGDSVYADVKASLPEG